MMIMVMVVVISSDQLVKWCDFIDVHSFNFLIITISILRTPFSPQLCLSVSTPLFAFVQYTCCTGVLNIFNGNIYSTWHLFRCKQSRNLLTIMKLLHKCDIIMSIVICAPDASSHVAASLCHVKFELFFCVTIPICVSIYEIQQYLSIFAWVELMSDVDWEIPLCLLFLWVVSSQPVVLQQHPHVSKHFVNSHFHRITFMCASVFTFQANSSMNVPTDGRKKCDSFRLWIVCN